MQIKRWEDDLNRRLKVCNGKEFFWVHAHNFLVVGQRNPQKILGV